MVQILRRAGLVILLLCASSMIAGCSGDEYDYSYDDFADLQEIPPLDTMLLSRLALACKHSPNYGKTVGVFGGSLSSNTESYAAKILWHDYLGMEVKTYGMMGHGFSSKQGSIQKQVRIARSHDIYILWCSTNDYTTNRPLGDVNDYTEHDGYDRNKLLTQCGGMNYCIKTLREKNPLAKIYVFGSLKFFSSEDGYVVNSEKTNDLGLRFTDYIEAQREVAERQGLKYFSQWDIPVITEDNATLFYKDDKVHMTREGYANVGVYQLAFLLSETE